MLHKCGSMVWKPFQSPVTLPLTPYPIAQVSTLCREWRIGSGTVCLHPATGVSVQAYTRPCSRPCRKRHAAHQAPPQSCFAVSDAEPVRAILPAISGSISNAPCAIERTSDIFLMEAQSGKWPALCCCGGHFLVGMALKKNKNGYSRFGASQIMESLTICKT